MLSQWRCSSTLSSKVNRFDEDSKLEKTAARKSANEMDDLWTEVETNATNDVLVATLATNICKLFFDLTVSYVTMSLVCHCIYDKRCTANSFIILLILPVSSETVFLTYKISNKTVFVISHHIYSVVVNNVHVSVRPKYNYRLYVIAITINTGSMV